METLLASKSITRQTLQGACNKITLPITSPLGSALIKTMKPYMKAGSANTENNEKIQYEKQHEKQYKIEIDPASIKENSEKTQDEKLKKESFNKGLDEKTKSDSLSKSDPTTANANQFAKKETEKHTADKKAADEEMAANKQSTDKKTSDEKTIDEDQKNESEILKRRNEYRHKQCKTFLDKVDNLLKKSGIIGQSFDIAYINFFSDMIKETATLNKSSDELKTAKDNRKKVAEAAKKAYVNLICALAESPEKDYLEELKKRIKDAEEEGYEDILEATDDEGNTPLWYACLHGSAETILFLAGPETPGKISRIDKPFKGREPIRPREIIQIRPEVWKAYQSLRKESQASSSAKKTPAVPPSPTANQVEQALEQNISTILLDLKLSTLWENLRNSKTKKQQNEIPISLLENLRNNKTSKEQNEIPSSLNNNNGNNDESNSVLEYLISADPLPVLTELSADQTDQPVGLTQQPFFKSGISSHSGFNTNVSNHTDPSNQTAASNSHQTTDELNTKNAAQSLSLLTSLTSGDEALAHWLQTQELQTLTDQNQTTRELGTQAQSTVPKQLSPTQATEGGGDCVFHAVFGEWNGKNIQCKDVNNKRRLIANAIRQCPENSPLFPLIVHAIQAILMGRESGFIGLKQEYGLYLAKNKKSIDVSWRKFESELKKYNDIIEFIQKKAKDKKEAKELREQFQHCLPLEGGLLYGLILSIDSLSKRFNDYNTSTNAGFDLKNRLLQNRKLLAEYAAYIEQPRQWLLPDELCILACVFNITIIFYTYNPYRKIFSSPDIYNPNQNKSVSVSFNGFGHFERIQSDILLNQFILKKKEDSHLKESADMKEKEQAKNMESGTGTHIVPDPTKKTAMDNPRTPAGSSSTVKL